MSNKSYKEYSEYLREKFGNRKVQKISVDAGFTCPNRDGTISRGGCIYCNPSSFTPGYCRVSGSVLAQLEEGKRFFSRKYPEMKYLAYFQSFTNTHAPLSTLMEIYEQAAGCKDVEGIIIGTRPDCMSDELLSYLSEMQRKGTPVIIEYGAETSNDATLHCLNRGHTWQQTVDAVRRTHEAGIDTGLHMIAWLPGETAADVLASVRAAVELPISSLKMHQLQVIRGTRLHSMIERGEIDLHTPTVEEYLNLCEAIIDIVPSRIALERFVSQSPADLLVSPKWGLKNYEFMNLLKARLSSH